ncbi:hypothetical protein ACSS6W_009362 [Trichoderma asperelloides]
MAVAAQPHVNPGWGRWPQQTSPSFPVMSSPGFTSYDPRSQVSSHIQRQVSPPYLMSSTYNHSPISAVSPPQYHSHSAFSYMPYHSPPPSTPLGAPFKAEFREQPYMVTEASAVDQRNLQSMKEYQPYSPISRRESVSSNTHSHITPGPATPGSFASGPISLSPIAPSSFIVARLDNSKTLSYNETLDPADKIDFKTDVDELMKAIQGSRSKGDYEQLPTPAPTPEYVATPPSTLHTQSGKPRKQWICDGPNCGRAFTQKTHRDIHQRTHTGHRPYTHQNNFHKATLKKLIALFVQFSEEGEVPEAYRELFDYFQKHYKNSNKGVKGRGKTRAVTARGPLHSVASQVSQLALPAQDPVVSSSPYTIPPGSTNILSSVLRNPNPSYSLYGPGSSPQMGPSSHLPY